MMQLGLERTGLFWVSSLLVSSSNRFYKKGKINAHGVIGQYKAFVLTIHATWRHINA